MKIIKKIALALLPLMLTSCIWFPEDDYSGFIQKTSIQDFSSVNEPEVLNFPLHLEFNLYNSQKNKTFPIFGNIYVIYDWEHDAVFDTIYAPAKNTMNGAVLLHSFGSGAGRKFFGYDKPYKALYELKTGETKLDKFPLENEFSYDTAITTGGKSDGRYGLYFYQTSWDPELDDRVIAKVFDSATGTFGKEIKINSQYPDFFDNVIQDSADDFYFIYRKKKGDSSEEKSVLCKINGAAQTITNDLKSFDSADEGSEPGTYSVLYVDDSSIYIRRIYSSDEQYKYNNEIIVLNKSNFEETARCLLDENEENWTRKEIKKAGSSLYLITSSHYSKKIKVEKLSVTGSTVSLEPLADVLEMEHYDEAFVKGNKIFFVERSIPIDEDKPVYNPAKNAVITIQSLDLSGPVPAAGNVITIHQSDLEQFN